MAKRIVKNKKPSRSMEQLAGPWLMAEDRVKAIFARVKGMPAESISPDSEENYKPEIEPSEYAVRGGMAIFNVCGVLTKYPMPESWMDEYCGFCPTAPIMQAVSRAAADWRVRSLLFVIDSPGGMVAGTSELAELIATVNKSKPCYAATSDQALSGGYYIASQCRSITCNAMGEVGCIGVYCLLCDDSKFWADMGVEWEVVSSGGVKGLGADGKVTQELRDDQQRGVDAMYEKFIADVADGRGISIEQSRQLGDGRCWIGPEALKLGLIDQVASVDAAVTAAIKETSSMTAEAFKSYAAENPEAAEVKELINKGHAAGIKAGAAQGSSEERARCAGILEAHGLKEHAVAASVTAGHDVETANVIARAAAKAKTDAEAKAKTEADTAAAALAQSTAALAEKDKKIAQLEFEKSGQGVIGTGGAPAAPAAGTKTEADFAKIEDPKERAKAEWGDNFNACRESFVSEAAFVGFRVADLRGGVHVTKAQAA